MKDGMSEEEIRREVFYSTLNEDMKNEILGFIDGFYQGLYNMLSNPEKLMTYTNYPDNWHQGHNKAVEIYQKYRDV